MTVWGVVLDFWVLDEVGGALEERWRSVSVGNRFRGSKEVSNLGGVPGGSSGSGGDTSSGETICDGL
jgi:hypothetical protein